MDQEKTAKQEPNKQNSAEPNQEQQQQPQQGEQQSNVNTTPTTDPSVTAQLNKLQKQIELLNQKVGALADNKPQAAPKQEKERVNFDA